MSKMKQSEWMRGLLDCENRINTAGFIRAEQHLYRMTEDFIRFNNSLFFCGFVLVFAKQKLKFWANPNFFQKLFCRL